MKNSRRGPGVSHRMTRKTKGTRQPPSQNHFILHLRLRSQISLLSPLHRYSSSRPHYLHLRQYPPPFTPHRQSGHLAALPPAGPKTQNDNAEWLVEGLPPVEGTSIEEEVEKEEKEPERQWQVPYAGLPDRGGCESVDNNRLQRAPSSPFLQSKHRGCGPRGPMEKRLIQVQARR